MFDLQVRFESIDVTEVDEAINSPNVLRAFASYRRSQFSQQIALGVNPYGEPLPPLSEAYAAWKQRTVGRRPTRVLSGETVKTYQQGFRGNSLVETIGGKAAFIQDRFPYLPDQERGMPVGDQEKLLELAVTEVERALRRAD